MCTLGQKQTLRRVREMSALPRKRTWNGTVMMSALCQQQPLRHGVNVPMMEKRALPSLVLAEFKCAVVRTERDHARRGRRCCKGLQSTAAPSRSHSGTEWRSGYVAK